MSKHLKEVKNEPCRYLGKNVAGAGNGESQGQKQDLWLTVQHHPGAGSRAGDKSVSQVFLLL